MRVAIVGASGQGRVVLDIISALDDPPEVRAVVDSGDTGKVIGQRLGEHRIEIDLRSIHTIAGDIDGVVPAVGDARARQLIAERADELSLDLISVVHPSAILASRVTLGAGTVVCAGAIIGVGSEIARGSIINTGSVVDHDCRVGEFSHVAPGAVLAGGVRTGRRVWVGAGATVLDDIEIGNDALVGAGAVVTRNVDAATTVVGVPARAMVEEVDEDE